MVAGADTLRFALYEDRTVISPIGVLRPNLKHSYNFAPYVADQPESLLYIRSEDGLVITMVYGLGFSAAMPPVWAGSSVEQKPGFPPKALLDLYKFLMCFDAQDLLGWISGYVELMIGSFGYAPGESVFWPEYWLEKNRGFDGSFERIYLYQETLGRSSRVNRPESSAQASETHVCHQ
ncbi:MAG TPA: hypothetical protein DEP36_06840 [Gammaproteobacteria bacterium]|nr:hypothetical protein [Gammaproteobacteria bacterium]